MFDGRRAKFQVARQWQVMVNSMNLTEREHGTNMNRSTFEPSPGNSHFRPGFRTSGKQIKWSFVLVSPLLNLRSVPCRMVVLCMAFGPNCSWTAQTYIIHWQKICVWLVQRHFKFFLGHNQCRAVADRKLIECQAAQSNLPSPCSP